MKSRFFVLVAILTIGLLFISTTKARATCRDYCFDFDRDGSCCDMDDDGIYDNVDDSDGDGVVDHNDECSELSGPIDNDGCPKIVAFRQPLVLLTLYTPDTDHDGVIDEDDNCSDTPSGITIDEEGCPVDSDEDGLTDDLDACPDVAANTEDGCAVAVTEPDTTEPDPIVGDKVPESDAGTPANEKEDISSCSLVQNGTGSFNGLVSIAVFAISLAPLTIRRRIKK